MSQKPTATRVEAPATVGDIDGCAEAAFLPLAARVPASLIKQLDEAARRGGRSRSSELRIRLEKSLRKMPVLTVLS